MGAQRLRRRIVWLLAVAALGVGAILGASAAAADENQPADSKWEFQPPDGSGPGASTQDSKWE